MLSALSPLRPAMADGGISGPKYGSLLLIIWEVATNCSGKEPSASGSSIALKHDKYDMHTLNISWPCVMWINAGNLVSIIIAEMSIYQCRFWLYAVTAKSALLWF